MTVFLRGLLAGHCVDSFGICRFRDIQPILPCRAVSRLPEKPDTVIVCLFPYYTGPMPGRNVSRYAAVDDYHRIAGGILSDVAHRLSGQYSDYHFVSFVDTSPIREVEAARLAGLGDIGKNGLLLHPVYGSYTFIGTIVTDCGLNLFERSAPDKSCNGCGACIRACPTGALQTEGFKKELCRSHITQKTGELTEWETAQIREGGLVWGCDRCLDACPRNRSVPLTPIQAFHRNVQPVLTKENLDELYPEKPYNYRKKIVLLRNLSII